MHEKDRFILYRKNKFRKIFSGHHQESAKVNSAKLTIFLPLIRKNLFHIN